MATPNHAGYTESAEKIAYRAEQRKAREIAYEVWNASQLTEGEIEALDLAMERTTWESHQRISDEQERQADDIAAYKWLDDDYNDLKATEEDARY